MGRETRGEVPKIVEAIVKIKGVKVNCCICNGWWCRSWEGWPSLSLCKGDPFSQVRAEMTTHKVFQDYLALLKETLEKVNVMDKPAQIYNCDDSDKPLEHKTPKTAAAKKYKESSAVYLG